MSLAHIKHVVVLMMENRSLDNMLGYLYAGQDNAVDHVIPAGGNPKYEGLAYYSPKDPANPFWNPTDAAFFSGGSSGRIYASREADSTVVPDPDPEEYFDDMTHQLFGPNTPSPSAPHQMKGFYLNYEKATRQAAQIMQCYAPSQLPVLNALARNYAVSDQWFASSPTQTWPNRSFVHTGTANGRVNNWPYDPYDFDIPTIFNTLEKEGIGWKVYNDTELTSLTHAQFPRLWEPPLEGHFHGFERFKEDAKHGNLPAYSFLEPSFLIEPNDDHPPHDVTPGELFILEAWDALACGENWHETLFVITYDEHGGCYDHVAPPFGARTPDGNSDPGQEGFYFNRFGVRVPTLVISPWVEKGTVFRSTTDTPYDHTSILSTLQSWKRIPGSSMPPSKRTQSAPTLDPILTRSTPREDLPEIAPPDRAKATGTDDSAPPNDIQLGMVVAAATRREGRSLSEQAVKDLLAPIKTRADAIEYLQRHARRDE